MLQDTKNQLSEFQLSVLKDTQFFDAKREGVRILSSHFHDLQEALAGPWQNSSLHPEFQGAAAKIFKGENYNGYPYVNMDFPRQFGTKSIFAFRSMFWWGHGFSFTLHLQGEAYAAMARGLAAKIRLLEGKGYYLCVNDSPWEYHYGEDNYRLLDEILVSGELGYWAPDKQFIKISRRLELHNYMDIVRFGSETFGELLRCLE